MFDTEANKEISYQNAETVAPEAQVEKVASFGRTTIVALLSAVAVILVVCLSGATKSSAFSAITSLVANGENQHSADFVIPDSCPEGMFPAKSLIDCKSGFYTGGYQVRPKDNTFRCGPMFLHPQQALDQCKGKNCRARDQYVQESRYNVCGGKEPFYNLLEPPVTFGCCDPKSSKNLYDVATQD